MAKKNIYLEKRIFLLFFLLSFLMILILIFIEWQLARYAIIQAEDKDINEVSFKLKNHLHEIYRERDVNLNSLISDPVFQSAAETKDFALMDSLLVKAEISGTYNISYYDQSQKQVLGEKWEFLDEQTEQIFSPAASNYSLSSYGGKFYFISYKYVYFKDLLYGYLVILEDLNLNSIPPLAPNLDYHFSAYPFLESSFNYSEDIQDRFQDFNDMIRQNMSSNKTESVIRISASRALGFAMCPNFGEPSTVLVIDYPREVYNFGQQSVLFFVLILLAATIMLISLFGNWFSRSILFPIRTINQRMNDISLNPSKIEPLKRNYQGVLGEMLSTFNSMNKSLNKYSENLREYKLISDNLDSGFFWLDSELKITLCNNSMFTILDINSSEELIDKNLNDFLKLNDNHLSIMQEDGITLHEWEINTGKERKYLLIKIMPVKQAEHLKFVGNITDITAKIEERTARQALELELIKSNKLAEIGRRIEGIVHNINSPLNTVLGYAQLMKRNQPDNRDLDKIMEAGKSISHIVKGVLNKSKLDSSSMVRVININNLIKQELELCNHNLFFKHYVDLKVELDDNLPNIHAVYGDISLCLANIINNAIETLEKRPEKNIWIKTSANENNLIIEIKDSGEGIRSKNLDVIFEPYFTTKLKPGDKGSGFGLGLAISKNIAGRYGGNIEVESVIDCGSVFKIHLPINNSN
jgi:signal transduction histidine kinase